MGKWTIGLILVALACLPIYLGRYSNPGMLQDTDTLVLLQTVRERDDPLSWFAGDWPLKNHFYRPISTLVFELDNAMFGSNAAGYGQTNAILCILCVLALFWFLRELTDRIEIALPGALLFVIWHFSLGVTLTAIMVWISVGTLGLLLWRPQNWKRILLAMLVLWLLASELGGMQFLNAQMLGWLPSRTASVMTLFALLSLAAYSRYERISATRLPVPEPSPLDPPATKSTAAPLLKPRGAWIWPILSLLCLALALGSYEQAVVLPGLLIGSALCLRLQRYRVRWAWQAPIWGLLVAYLALRANLVPSEISGYQAQQFRSGPGVWFSLLGYLFPSGPGLWQSFVAYDVPMLYEVGGFAGLIAAFPFSSLMNLGSNVATIVAARSTWLLLLTGLCMSFVAFLPMAWLKHFIHYHYFPMAIRALFVAALLGVAGKALVSAVSLPALQAPPRPDPAPGSLPRPSGSPQTS